MGQRGRFLALGWGKKQNRLHKKTFSQTKITQSLTPATCQEKINASIDPLKDGQAKGSRKAQLTVNEESEGQEP